MYYPSNMSNATASMNLRIAPTRNALGLHAALDIAAELRTRLAHQPEVRIIFAAAPSQSATLAHLIQQPGIDWSRITAFHMDEYIGLPAGTPQLFSEWLNRAIFNVVPFAAIHRIIPGPNPQATCDEYAALLATAPIDLCLLGIGSNAHLAFNDPPADLNDPATVKIVALDLACRQQQVDDECFALVDDVPTHAITLTIPALLGAQKLFCSVPGSLKQAAVRDMVTEPISGNVPATALRNHADCVVYLDHDSSALLS
jgi:glucosamine-6-phosphate deaminase